MLIKILAREFDTEKINPTHPSFDKCAYEDYKAFLLSIPETDVVKMPIEYAYARIKLIGQKEQAEYLRSVGYIPDRERLREQSPITSNRISKPTKIFKHWNHD